MTINKRDSNMKTRNPSIVGKAQNAVQIQPPQGPLRLYTPYKLTVTADPTEVYGVIWTVGPEDPSPGEGKPGHTFLFDGSPNGFTEMKDGTGTINITAIGPNIATKVTVYARSVKFDNTPIDSAVLEFGAVEYPPDRTVGIASLDGAALLTDTAVHLFRATYADADGTPLTGEITWQATISNVHDTLLLTGQTPLIQDGTAINGVHYPQILAEGTLELTATAPDGRTGRLSQAISMLAPSPSIIITADDPPHQLTAKYPANPSGGTDILWEAFPADQVQLANRTTQTTLGGVTQNTIRFTGGAPVTAYISASTFNAKTGTRDYGTLRLTLTPA